MEAGQPHGAEDGENVIAQGEQNNQMEAVNAQDGQNNQMEEVNAQVEQNGQNEAGRTGLCDCQRPANPTCDRCRTVLLKENNLVRRLGLFTAALNGDWKAAESIDRYAAYVNCYVTEDHQTSLHVAAGAQHLDFVKKLVNRGNANLGQPDKKGNTAFCHAVMAGSIPVAKFLLEKEPQLAFIRGGENSTPLFIAVIFGHRDMALHLLKVTESNLSDLEPNRLKEMFLTCFETDMFDIALRLLRGCADPAVDDLAVARNTDGDTALHLLAQRPSAFDRKRSVVVKMLSYLCNYEEPIDNTAVELVQSLWKAFLNKRREDPEAGIDLPVDVIFKAAELGNYKFLAVLIRQHPALIWEVDKKNRTIFHIAAMHRQVDVFSQIYGLGSIKDLLVAYKISCDSPESDSSESNSLESNSSESDNILHLTAKMPSPHELSNVSGSALQMQREFSWFQEVKSLISASDREKKGSKKVSELTPRQLFSKEHAELLGKAEKWMWNTSTSCLIIATIITTVVYSAGFSLPGGHNESTSSDNATIIGSPVHIKHTLFHVFAVSEAVALSFSVTSALIFLFILTSRYTEENFLKSLPLSLMFGLVTLFISVMAMVVSFSSAFFLAYRKSKLGYWVPISGAVLALLPAGSFCFLQYPLLRDILKFTCRRSFFRAKVPLFKSA